MEKSEGSSSSMSLFDEDPCFGGSKPSNDLENRKGDCGLDRQVCRFDKNLVYPIYAMRDMCDFSLYWRCFRLAFFYRGSMHGAIALKFEWMVKSLCLLTFNGDVNV